MMARKLIVWIQWLQKYVERPWYNPVISFLAWLDIFILIIPTDGLVVSSVLLCPRRWVGAFLWVSIGSTFGTLCLCLLVQWDADWVMHSFLPFAFDTSLWGSTDAFLKSYGLIALALIAFTPLPQMPAAVMAALAHVPLWEITLSVFAGRVIKYALYAWAASHAPRYVLNIPFIKSELEQLHALPSESQESKT
jgi:membrane protein YqaA with SNARE-associated domain